MNFIFIFISSSDPNLLQKKIGETKNKRTMALADLQTNEFMLLHCMIIYLS